MPNRVHEKRTVLIIDEDPQLVGEFSKRCESVGLDVSTASNVREAALIFDTALPDLLIFDFNLTSGNDKRFVDCLAEHEDTRSIPMIWLCDQPDFAHLKNLAPLLGYFVNKDIENWWRTKMFIFELTDLNPLPLGNNSAAY